MDKSLKVFYFNSFLNSESGEGVVARQFLEAASHLDGWKLVTVPNLLAKGSPKDRQPALQMPMDQASIAKLIRERIRHHSIFSPIRRYRHVRRIHLQFRNVWKEAGPVDVMLLATRSNDLEALAAYCRNTTTPIVIIATAPIAYEKTLVQNTPLSRRDRANEHFLYKRADAIIVVSESMKQLLITEGVDPEKIFPIPNGIDFDHFNPEKVDGSIVRSRYNLTDRKVVGYIGGFWLGNDIETLLKAWKPVELAEPSAVLLLVGDGKMRSYAQNLSAELKLQNCIWVGRVKHTEIPVYSSAMDVSIAPYVRPALAYVSPLKVMEYMVMGLPVVAAKGGQIEELIEHGVTGYLYGAGSSTQLTRGILDLLASTEETKAMGERARQRIQQSWSNWNEVARKVMSICIQVAG